ncbi:MAG: hypothetical protein ACE5I1_04375, partial [bacterium]
ADFWGDAVELKEAGLWLKEHTNHEPVLMSYNKAVDFYAGIYNIRNGVSISNDDFHRVLSYAKHRKAEYLVLSQRYADKFPKLNFLFQSAGLPEELEPVFESENFPGTKVKIFKLLQ